MTTFTTEDRVYAEMRKSPLFLTEEDVLHLIADMSTEDGQFTFESFWLKFARKVEYAVLKKNELA
jgi:hypothetical protein